MKIAFLNIYSGLVNRGAETFVKEVASRVSGNVDVLQAGEGTGSAKYNIITIKSDLNWKHADASGSLLRKLFIDYWSIKIFVFTLKCLPLIIKNRYDIVVPLNGGWQPALIRIATWLYGGKMVISGQSGLGWDDRNNLWCFPDAFVGLSTHAKIWAKKVNPFVKTVYIPNGVDLRKFSPKGAVYKTNLNKPIILCVSALTKIKRVDLVVKAVSKLPEASLLVVGDGEEMEKIRQMGHKLLGSKRFEMIQLSFEKMPSVYRGVDLFTNASEAFISFEIVLTEAMASGLAVVANRDPIRKEIVGDAGLLVDPTNTKEYSNALGLALTKNWRNKAINQAKNFDWDKISKMYDHLFLSLLSSKNL